MNLLTKQLRRLDAAFLVLEKQWPWLLALFVFVLLAVTLLFDAKRPFWNDELFTFYISRQPSLRAVWSVLETGAEQLPVFFFVVIRMFTSHSHAGLVPFRLPETLGFVAMCVCAFLFVRKRSPASYAFIAFLLPCVTDAYSYAYEARPYGIVMGFTGLAMLCWQRAAERPGRSIPLLGMAVFLACATNSHYYAVLLLFPFGIAEVVRYLQTRKLDFAMYLALLFSLAPLVFSLPLIRAASRFSSHFWAKPSWTFLISFYELLLTPAGLSLLLILLISGAYLTFWPTTDDVAASENLLVAHEVALCVAFALLPGVVVVLAKFVTGAFTFRYVIYSVLGLSILSAWSLENIGRRRVSLGLLLSAVILGCWLVVVVRLYTKFTSMAQGEVDTFRFLRAHEGRLPVVMTSPHEFFVEAHRAAEEGQGTFLYLADVPLALHYTETDTVERGLLALRNYAPLHVEDYHSFLNAHPSFLVYRQPDAFGWVLEALIQEGKTLAVVARNGDDLLYLVEPGNLSQDRSTRALAR